MSRSKSSRTVTVERPVALALELTDDESDVDIVVDGEVEKDQTEIDLERLVFGDGGGFRQGLKDFSYDNNEADGKELVLRGEDDEDERTGLEGLDDADLFFTDTGAEQDQQPGLTGLPESDEDETSHSRQPAAWEDSDDERLTVSLASVPRLRKLRRTEAEDVVNGKEYSRRLRQQFELLSPRPAWAIHATQQPARKKRRTSRYQDEDSAEEMDLDDSDSDLPSVAPLSKLLQDAQSLIRSAGPGAGKKRKIRPEVIDIQRTKDIAGTQPSSITTLSFHPTLPLMLSACGPASTLYLHHIAPSPPAPTPNPLLTSLHVRGSPLSTTAFHPTDSRIFLSARRRYFHVWNLSTGQVEKIARVYGQQHEQRSMERFKLSPDGQHMALLGSTRQGGGVINILSAGSLQWVSQVRVESSGGISDFAWWRNGQGLCIVAKNGEVTEWSIASQSVVARWQDEGAVGSTTLALGGQHEHVKSPFGNDRWVVVGSSSGIVNIYDRRAWLAEKDATRPIIPTNPKPTKTFDHLTTPISVLAFSPDAQVLAMASKWKRDALRLVHLPTCTVFRNWPTSSTPLGRITAVAFCDGAVAGGENGYTDVHSLLGVANEQGKIKLWEIR